VFEHQPESGVVVNQVRPVETGFSPDRYTPPTMFDGRVSCNSINIVVCGNPANRRRVAAALACALESGAPFLGMHHRGMSTVLYTDDEQGDVSGHIETFRQHHHLAPDFVQVRPLTEEFLDQLGNMVFIVDAGYVMVEHEHIHSLILDGPFDGLQGDQITRRLETIYDFYSEAEPTLFLLVDQDPADAFGETVYGARRRSNVDPALLRDPRPHTKIIVPDLSLVTPPNLTVALG
jgi:hypothetical protein